MDYNQLIKNWHSKASDEDYFSKYVFEYLAFIGFLKRIKFIDQNTDTGAVRALKHSAECRDLYLRKITGDQELTFVWSVIKNELDRQALRTVDENSGQVRNIQYWRCSHPQIGQPNHECEEQGRLRGLDDWENMVEFWHSIRNNLFHAAKDPHDERDQILIENGYKTLRPLVQILIDSRAS